MSIVFSGSGAFFQSIYVLSLRHAYSLLAPSWLLRSGARHTPMEDCLLKSLFHGLCARNAMS